MEDKINLEEPSETSLESRQEAPVGGVVERQATRQVAFSRLLHAANYSALVVGSLSATLLTRFYFVHGGSNRWVSTMVQCAGFPLLVVPTLFFLPPSRAAFTRRLIVLCLLIGLLLGVNNLFISWGVSYLPVSTASLVLSSQLAFTLVLSVALVRQPVHFTNLNCVLIITLASVLLALNSPNERPKGVTATQFVLGFLATLGAAVMFALYLPLVQIAYRRVSRFRTVLEMQIIMEAAATAFAVVGMAAGGGFGQMSREATTEFDLGRTWYWVTIVATIFSWQLCFMGTAGVVYLTSSLNSGICSTAMLAVNVVGGVVAFGDKFGGLKAVALVLCMWGFISYLYGEHKRSKKKESRSDDTVREAGNYGFTM